MHLSKIKRIPWALLALGPLTLLSGCGSSDSGNTQPNPIPLLAFTNGQAASVVIGQEDFDSTSANQGGSAGAVTVNGPAGNPALYDGVLYLPHPQ